MRGIENETTKTFSRYKNLLAESWSENLHFFELMRRLEKILLSFEILTSINGSVSSSSAVCIAEIAFSTDVIPFSSSFLTEGA